MTDDEIVRRLVEAAATERPVDVALLLDRLATDGLTQASLVSCFKRAFPSIPIRTLLECGAWMRVSSGQMTDEELDSVLGPFMARGRRT